VEGEAGVDKTRLLEEVLRYAETHGARVLRGRCYEFGGGVPYQPIAEALRDHLRDAQPTLPPVWLSELARLLPELRAAHPTLPEAGRVMDQERRLELYRQADELLVNEVLILPLTYEREHLLIKPWVRHYPMTASRVIFWKDVILETSGA
jgi:predicted ATPase